MDEYQIEQALSDSDFSISASESDSYHDDMTDDDLMNQMYHHQVNQLMQVLLNLTLVTI